MDDCAKGILAPLVVLILVGAGVLWVMGPGWSTVGPILEQAAQGLDPKGTPPPRGAAGPVVDGQVPLRFEWSYEGSQWSFELTVPLASYEWFQAQDRPERYEDTGTVVRRHIAYDALVTNPHDDATIQAIADELRRAGEAADMQGDEILSFTLSFVQSLEYTSDKVTSGFDEYPRFPLETLVDLGGDCEDTSILYASLIQALGYGAILVGPPGHMAVGVQAAQGAAGYGYTFEGARYLYAETTGSNWRIGEVPDVYRGAEVEVFPLVPQPLFNLDVVFGDVDGQYQEFHLTAKNTGAVAAQDVQLFAGITGDGQHFTTHAQCPFATVAPGDEIRCTLRLDLSKAPKGSYWAEASVQDGSIWYAKVKSQTIHR